MDVYFWRPRTKHVRCAYYVVIIGVTLAGDVHVHRLGLHKVRLHAIKAHPVVVPGQLILHARATRVPAKAVRLKVALDRILRGKIDCVHADLVLP